MNKLIDTVTIPLLIQIMTCNTLAGILLYAATLTPTTRDVVIGTR